MLLAVVTSGILAVGVWAQEPDLTLDVTHRARSVQPGEVVVLEVRPSAAVVAIHAMAFGSSVPFFASGPDGVWRGVVGIDLEARPAEYSVALRAKTFGGATVRTTYTLVVTPKEFPTRHLEVAPSFVDPPAEVVDRIQRATTSRCPSTLAKSRSPWKRDCGSRSARAAAPWVQAS